MKSQCSLTSLCLRNRRRILPPCRRYFLHPAAEHGCQAAKESRPTLLQRSAYYRFLQLFSFSRSGDNAGSNTNFRESFAKTAQATSILPLYAKRRRRRKQKSLQIESAVLLFQSKPLQEICIQDRV